MPDHTLTRCLNFPFNVPKTWVESIVNIRRLGLAESVIMAEGANARRSAYEKQSKPVGRPDSDRHTQNLAIWPESENNSFCGEGRPMVNLEMAQGTVLCVGRVACCAFVSSVFCLASDSGSLSQLHAADLEDFKGERKKEKAREEGRRLQFGAPSCATHCKLKHFCVKLWICESKFQELMPTAVFVYSATMHVQGPATS